jgi:hypothetical protein
MTMTSTRTRRRDALEQLAHRRLAHEIAAYLQRAETERLEQMSTDLDTHPLFARFTGEERRWFGGIVPGFRMAGRGCL